MSRLWRYFRPLLSRPVLRVRQAVVCEGTRRAGEASVFRLHLHGERGADPQAWMVRPRNQAHPPDGLTEELWTATFLRLQNVSSRRANTIKTSGNLWASSETSRRPRLCAPERWRREHRIITCG